MALVRVLMIVAVASAGCGRLSRGADTASDGQPQLIGYALPLLINPLSGSDKPPRLRPGDRVR